jgi:hypothetical protein
VHPHSCHTQAYSFEFIVSADGEVLPEVIDGRQETAVPAGARRYLVSVKATAQASWEANTPFVLSQQELNQAKRSVDAKGVSVSYWILLVSNALRHPEVALCVRDVASLSLAPTLYRAHLAGVGSEPESP